MEIAHKRSAILQKLNGLLLSQRNKFYDHLALLELEERDIKSGDFQKLKLHTEMEKEILDGIAAFQKVIESFTEMYQDKGELSEIRTAITGLKVEIGRRNIHNRHLLAGCMKELKKELLAIKRPFMKASPFVSNAPSLIDITT